VWESKGNGTGRGEGRGGEGSAEKIDEREAGKWTLI